MQNIARTLEEDASVVIVLGTNNKADYSIVAMEPGANRLEISANGAQSIVLSTDGTTFYINETAGSQSSMVTGTVYVSKETRATLGEHFGDSPTEGDLHAGAASDERDSDEIIIAASPGTHVTICQKGREIHSETVALPQTKECVRRNRRGRRAPTNSDVERKREIVKHAIAEIQNLPQNDVGGRTLPQGTYLHAIEVARNGQYDHNPTDVQYMGHFLARVTSEVPSPALDWEIAGFNESQLDTATTLLSVTPRVLRAIYREDWASFFENEILGGRAALEKAGVTPSTVGPSLGH